MGALKCGCNHPFFISFLISPSTVSLLFFSPLLSSSLPLLLHSLRLPSTPLLFPSLSSHAGLKHRDERLLGASSDVKTSASPFVDVDEEEDPQVLYDKVCRGWIELLSMNRIAISCISEENNVLIKDAPAKQLTRIEGII